MTDLYRRLHRLYIEDRVVIGSVIITRVAYNRFSLQTDQQVEFVGGKNYSLGLAIAKTVEKVTGIAQPEPCACCGELRVVDSYCRPCFNRIHAEGKRKRR